MPKLARSKTGAYTARKAVPEDVRDEYQRLFGKRREERFHSMAGTPHEKAKAGFGKWIAEVEGRVAAIRGKSLKSPPHGTTIPANVPNALQGFSENRDKPAQIDSATREVRDEDKVVTFLGNVRLVQGDTVLRSKSLRVFYDQDAMPSSRDRRLRHESEYSYFARSGRGHPRRASWRQAGD